MAILQCPICDHPFDSDQSIALPFCSQRCKRIDLGRWLDERYALPIERPEQADAEAADEGE
jgi:uncharacterized protein